MNAFIKGKKVYFDNNIYDHILKKIDFTESDLNNLINFIDLYEIEFNVSVHNLAEILLICKKNHNLAIRELKLLKKIGNLTKLVKSADIILKDDITAVIEGERLQEPWIYINNEFNPINEFESLLKPNTPDEINETLLLIKQIQEQGETFSKALLQEINNMPKTLRNVNRSEFTSQEYFDSIKIHFLNELLNRYGLKDPKNAILKNYEKIESLQAFVVYGSSLTYSMLFDKRKPKPSDSRDMLHFIVAAATSDLFVTNDRKFRRILNKFPIKNFPVIDLLQFKNKYLK